MQAANPLKADGDGSTSGNGSEDIDKAEREDDLYIYRFQRFILRLANYI